METRILINNLINFRLRPFYQFSSAVSVAVRYESENGRAPEVDLVVTWVNGTDPKFQETHGKPHNLGFEFVWKSLNNFRAKIKGLDNHMRIVFEDMSSLTPLTMYLGMKKTF